MAGRFLKELGQRYFSRSNKSESAENSLVPKKLETDDPYIQEIIDLIKEFNGVVDEHLKSGKVKLSDLDVDPEIWAQFQKDRIGLYHGTQWLVFESDENHYRLELNGRNFDDDESSVIQLISLLFDKNRKNRNPGERSDYFYVDLQAHNNAVTSLIVEYNSSSGSYQNEEAVKKMKQLLEDFKENP